MQSAVLRSHVVRLSVRLYVCDVGDLYHIGWKSWKLIVRAISPTPSFFAAKKRSTYSRGNVGEIFWETRGGVGKMAFWRTKAAISLKRVKMEEKLLGGPIGTHQRSFDRCHPRTHMASPSSRWGFISRTCKATDFKSNLAGTFTGPI